MTDTKTYNRHGVDQLLHEAVRVLAGYDPDRARVRNGVGFNGRDGEFGHAMSEKPFEDITPNMARAMRKMVTTYRVQLAGYGIDVEAIDMSRVGQPQPKQPEGARITRAQDGALIFRSPKDHAAIALVRALRERRWTGAEGTPPFCWRLALERSNLDGLRELYRLGTVEFSPDAIAALRGLSAPPASQNGGNGAPSPRPVSAPPTAAQAPTNGTAGTAGTAPTVPAARASLEKQGDETQTQAPQPLRECPQGVGMVRVAYVVADDNTIVYRLKLLPAGQLLSANDHTYPTPQDAQRAADRLNTLLADRVELS